MKSNKLTFKKFYIAYVALLVVLVIAAVFYVSSLLREYEALRPEKCAADAMEQLIADASTGDLWSKYALEEPVAGDFEQNLDVKNEYLALFDNENLRYVQQSGAHAEDELYYTVESNGVAIAEVKLKAMGPTFTKLIVLSSREWQAESVKPVLGTSDYTISVPSDFTVQANGIELTEENAEKKDAKQITYTVGGVYLEPVFDIKDQNGAEVSYTVRNNKVIAEFYDYTLTLPAVLGVVVNGEEAQGMAAGGGQIRYDIRTLEKPEVSISDSYGNTVNYEGGKDLPLTYMKITADKACSVTVAGQTVPDVSITPYNNLEYEPLLNYVENLPEEVVYEVAVLSADAEVVVTDAAGNTVTLDNSQEEHDFTVRKEALAEVPESVSSEVDVLDIAQKWSLFMSNDLAFSKIQGFLIADSYQYDVARKYATGIDITFTSNHVLLDPPFTENEVTNFVWIADNCFSVDISFVKHMRTARGNQVDDVMNDRFYFVKQDDAWKLVSMKEIVSNE